MEQTEGSTRRDPSTHSIYGPLSNKHNRKSVLCLCSRASLLIGLPPVKSRWYFPYIYNASQDEKVTKTYVASIVTIPGPITAFNGSSTHKLAGQSLCTNPYLSTSIKMSIKDYIIR